MPEVAFIASVALLNSLSHCVGMCGGFNALLSVSLRQKSRSQKVLNYAFFHLGRVGIYALLGALVASFGAGVLISQTSRALLFFAVGCFMVFVAAALYFRGSILAILESRSLAIAINRASANIAQSLKNPNFSAIKVLVFGGLNGLLPCGLVYYFLSYAMLSKSWQNGALTMAIFGICTLPTLLFTGVFTGVLARYRGLLFKAAILLIGANGLYLAYLGYRAYG